MYLVKNDVCRPEMSWPLYKHEYISFVVNETIWPCLMVLANELHPTASMG